MSTIPKCQLCGELMPPGEEMFFYHGYSGPCPKPPLVKTASEICETALQKIFCAEKSFAEAMEKSYPIGARVIVRHRRGTLFGIVDCLDPSGRRVVVTNDATQRCNAWNFRRVELLGTEEAV